MTRFLSDSLQAPEPFFRLGLRRLEAMHGNPSNDIRLTSEIIQQTQSKIRMLGLDPLNTTPKELYRVLGERLKADDAALIKMFRTSAASYVSAEADITDGLTYTMKELAKQTSCFAIKSSKIKSIIRKLPPKKTMKLLGYRSLESFLKHESVVSILAAAWFTEAPSWFDQLSNMYEKLKPSDFESRHITVFNPTSKKWASLASQKVYERKHNLICFRELGAIVILPLPSNIPEGVVTVSTTLALHEFNEIRTCGTFLKFCQVRPDFGELVQMVVDSEPRLSSSILERPVPWHLIQRYYKHLSEDLKNELFEPHIHEDDMVWHSIEHDLSKLLSRLKFWQGNSHLALMDDHAPVSLNILDTALSVCNHLPFERRISHAFQKSLWNELLLKYLNHDTVEQTVLTQLQPQLQTGNRAK